jgi:cyclopropane-fatty-acyl-phospholipid synthase
MIDLFLRTQIHRRLQALRAGTLTVRNGLDSRTFGGATRPDLRAVIDVRSPGLYRRLATGGALGAAESYLRGEWTADDLTMALRIFAANLDAADGLESRAARALNLGSVLAHRLRRNTRAGSRRNIHDHYDLGNDLFALFLDDTMTYSCGIFELPDATMREASVAKLDAVCRKLELSPRDHVLEIGTGWGSFAIHAAGRYGCRVTTTTISDAQYEVAASRIAAAGVADRVTLLKQDYRELGGTYGKLVSIEMIEAVGPQYLDAYFESCSRLLRPDGQMLLQGIVMPEHRYAGYLRSADFIQRYVFPGSALVSIGAISASLGRASDFSINHVEDLAPHYAATLRRWRDRFMGRLDEVRALGYDERFTRLWEYYLAYCEAGFAERCTGVVQVLLTKPACRRGDVRDVLEGLGGFAALDTPTRAMPLELAG